MSRLLKDPVVKELIRLGRPLTRENWLGLAFTDDPPENWEHETDMPYELRDLEPGQAYTGHLKGKTGGVRE